jgi:hypothetical protein
MHPASQASGTSTPPDVHRVNVPSSAHTPNADIPGFAPFVSQDQQAGLTQYAQLSIVTQYEEVPLVE